MTVMLRTVVCFFSLFFVLSASASAWFDSNYQYRRKITINHAQVGTGPHTDFPILITAASFNSTFFDHVAKTTTSNLDLVFVANDDTTQLDREVVYYNKTGNGLEAWIRIPTLASAADTVIYAYYGYASANEPNNTTTWSTDYKAVYHLQTYGSTMADSSANLNTATTHNMATSNIVTAKIGNGANLDGSNEYLTAADSGSLRVTGELTVSAWMKPQTTTRNVYDRLISKKSAWDAANGYEFEFNASTGISRASICTGGSEQVLTNTSPGFSTSWTYMVGVVGDPDTTHGKIYVNGSDQTSDTTAGSLTIGSDNLGIGGQPSGSALFQGVLDEVRIQSVARSAGWVTTEYNNQNAPTSFVSVDAEETPVVGSPTDTPTVTPTPTETLSSTATPTWTETPTVTATPTPSITRTSTITRTNTPGPSPTRTPTATVTPTITPSRTITCTWVPTATPSLTRSATITLTPTITQTATPDLPANDLSQVQVYPNPYRADRNRSVVTFFNLPAQATIRIYTLDGRLVKTLEKNSPSNRISWNLLNESGSGLASGVYVYVVKTQDRDREGKLAVLR